MSLFFFQPIVLFASGSIVNGRSTVTTVGNMNVVDTSLDRWSSSWHRDDLRLSIRFNVAAIGLVFIGWCHEC